jgi:hypothetical protein
LPERASNGMYKIGRALNPNARIGRLTGTIVPLDVEALACCEAEDYVGLEMELHERFVAQRGRGEWFAFTDEEGRELREYLQRIDLRASGT